MKITTRITLLGSIAGVLSLFGNGCGQIAVFEANVTEQSSSLSNVETIEGKPIPINVSLQTGEQILKSMLQATGLKLPDPTNNEVIRQYERTTSIFSPGFSYQNYTAPMGIAVTSLALEVCRQTISGELANPKSVNTTKDIFSSIPTADRTLTAFNETKFAQHLDYMSLKYYGRQLASVEIEKFKTARVEFESELTDAEKRSASEFTDFMLFNCSAMLSSFSFLFL